MQSKEGFFMNGLKSIKGLADRTKFPGFQIPGNMLKNLSRSTRCYRNLVSILLVVSLVFPCGSILAQSAFTQGPTLEESCDFFKTDPLGNLYLVKGYNLIKYDQTGAVIGNYGNPAWGPIGFIDAVDPFRILVFYRDYNLIVFLGKDLDELRSPIYLDDLNYPDVPAVCSSPKGGFWIYDAFEMRLIRINQNLEKDIVGVSLSSLVSAGINPTDMKEVNNQVYLHMEGLGILVLDVFGSYKTTLPVQCERFFQVIDRYLFYLKENVFHQYDLQSYMERPVDIPTHIEVEGIAIQGRNLYIRQKNRILSYKIN
jgi:hypothetical protein